MDKKVEEKINMMLPLLNEKQRRIYLASEAIASGRGGVTDVSRASGVSRSVINAGIKDINEGNDEVLSVDAPIRRRGAGRKPITETQPGIKEALERLVSDSTFGDPMNPLLWTTKSVRNLADELVGKGFKIGYRKVAYLLEDMGYSLQMNQKMNQVGEEHPELQNLANETGLEISVCHFPPGTSKWNKIEHRMFSQISKNWRGRPLESLAVIVNLIAATTTTTGLTIQCQLDLNNYPKGIKITDEELASVNIVGDAFHPNWNYTIIPLNG